MSRGFTKPKEGFRRGWGSLAEMHIKVVGPKTMASMDDESKTLTFPPQRRSRRDEGAGPLI